MESVIISVFIYFVINILLYGIAKIRHYSTLESVSLYAALLYPILLMVILFNYFMFSYVTIFIFLVAIAILYYLFVYFPRQSSSALPEPFDNSPIGPTVGSKGEWDNTAYNPTYYPDPAPNNAFSSIGAGPCLADNNFGITLGQGGCQTNCSPTSSGGGVAGGGSTGGGVAGGGSTGGGVAGGGSTGGGVAGDGSNGEDTNCIRTDSPPTVENKTGANFNFWCRYAKHNFFSGFQKLFPCNSAPDSETAKCSTSYYNGLYKWGDSKTVSNTECMPWNGNFVMGCSPNTFIRKIPGNCPPGYGIGICKKN